MISCGGTSITTVRKLTFTILSITGIRRINPGPFTPPPPIKRPRRNMTPRSYSLKMRMALDKIMTPKTIRTDAIAGNCCIKWFLFILKWKLLFQQIVSCLSYLAHEFFHPHRLFPKGILLSRSRPVSLPHPKDLVYPAPLQLIRSTPLHLLQLFFFVLLTLHPQQKEKTM